MTAQASVLVGAATAFIAYFGFRSLESRRRDLAWLRGLVFPQPPPGQSMEEPRIVSTIRDPAVFMARLPNPFPWDELDSVVTSSTDLFHAQDGSYPNEVYGVTWYFAYLRDPVRAGTGYNAAGAVNADNVVECTWKAMPDEYKAGFKLYGKGKGLGLAILKPIEAATERWSHWADECE